MGIRYSVQITEITARRVVCAIHARETLSDEPPTRLHLAVGLLKNPARFDTLVEKTTELGARAIIPLITERTVARHGRCERWRKIAQAAMKQSGRCILPIIQDPLRFHEFLATLEPDSLRLIAHETVASPTMKSLSTSKNSSTYICIGPEGGFTEEEISEAVGNGFTVVGMGARRLRTETAAIVAAARLLLE
jgi:16S rRNA (uracil1498-N3)-methyltransferase